MAKTKNEVAAQGTFELVSAYADMDEELRAELQDELDDLGDGGGIDCRQIKMPTGKVKAFAVESDDPDDPDMEKELTGVILFTHLMNARWEGDYGGENRIPVCSSWDGKQGAVFETGEICDCDRCQYNQFRDDGSGIVRKECKNMRRIYMVLNGRPQLYLLTVPPTSLKDVRTQLKRIMAGGLPYTRMVVTFRLTGATSKGGNDYAKLTVEKSGVLTPEQCLTTRAMREEIRKQYQSVAITNDDYYTPEPETAAAPAPETSTDGFMNAPEEIQEELPFA